jgi:hypothetical protein
MLPVQAPACARPFPGLPSCPRTHPVPAPRAAPRRPTCPRHPAPSSPPPAASAARRRPPWGAPGPAPAGAPRSRAVRRAGGTGRVSAPSADTAQGAAHHGALECRRAAPRTKHHHSVPSCTARQGQNVKLHLQSLAPRAHTSKGDLAAAFLAALGCLGASTMPAAALSLS